LLKSKESRVIWSNGVVESTKSQAPSTNLKVSGVRFQVSEMIDLNTETSLEVKPLKLDLTQGTRFLGLNE
jgi:hypothetical protein